MPPLIPPVAPTLARHGRAPAVETRIFEPDFLSIRCPRCGWQPQKSDRWLCSPGCEHSWNTFETAGICPGCAKSWRETACLSCHQWSPHDDWYEQSHSR